jgi:hypothetical protein
LFRTSSGISLVRIADFTRYRRTLVDMGDGTAPLNGVPFSATVTTQGLALTLGVTALPRATFTAGSITIE